MSGGHYDYAYSRLEYLADSIEEDFKDRGKFIDLEEYDWLEGTTEEEREEILKDIQRLVKDLRSCSKRAKALEWYLSSDAGIEDLKEDLKEL